VKEIAAYLLGEDPSHMTDGKLKAVLIYRGWSTRIVLFFNPPRPGPALNGQQNP